MGRNHVGRLSRVAAAALAVGAAGITAGAAAAATGTGETVFVPGRAEPWTTTSIELHQGQAFTVNTDGAGITWLRALPGSLSGPAGQWATCEATNTTPNADCAMNGAPYGALIARIGQTTLTLGAGGTFTAPSDGDLELAVNDNHGFYHDNSGGYAVHVTP